MSKWIGAVTVVVVCAFSARGDAAPCPTGGGGCGLNGGWLGENIPFHELDWNTKNSVEVKLPQPNGQPDKVGKLRITKVVANGTSTRLEVKDDVLMVKLGNELKPAPPGTEIMVELTQVGAKPKTFTLKIGKTVTSRYWTKPLSKDTVPVYFFEWTQPNDTKTYQLCEPSMDPEVEGVKDTAVIFTGNHYEPSFTVHKSTDNAKWKTRFNVACVGTTLAKLHLHRHTFAAQKPRADRIEQQQALLKLLTADYCGDGTSHTVNGRQLEYTYKQSEFQPNDPPFSYGNVDRLDGMWSDKGAVCIKDPRPETGTTPQTISCSNGSIPTCYAMAWFGSLPIVRPQAYATAIWHKNVATPGESTGSASTGSASP